MEAGGNGEGVDRAGEKRRRLERGMEVDMGGREEKKRREAEMGVRGGKEIERGGGGDGGTERTKKGWWS